MEGQSRLTQGSAKKPKSEHDSTSYRLTKCVTLKYNTSKAISAGVAGAKSVHDPRESSLSSSSNFPGLVSPFLFVPIKYWIELEEPDKLLKVSNSPREMPTWQMPATEHTRCGMSNLMGDPFSDQKTHSVRSSYMPVFLVAQVTSPYYRYFTSAGRSTKEDWVLLDRLFLEESARLESARALLQKNANDIESALANYTASMSKWRSEKRHWEVQTIYDEIEADNIIIFRHRITKKDLEDLDKWLEVEERKESEGQYDAWYCGVLRLGHGNIFPNAHLLRSIPIKQIADQRLANLRVAIGSLGKLIDEFKSKPTTCSPSGPSPTPKPLIDLPDYSSEDDERIALDKQHVANLTVWAYERHLHWIPRDSEAKKKYKFKTEDDVYKFFQIKKLTCADSIGSVGNNGLFREHIQIPQDLARCPWGVPFHTLDKTISNPVHRMGLYSEAGRTLLRDMEVEYFKFYDPYTPEKSSQNWLIPEDLADRMCRFIDWVNEGKSVD
ncbi:uncharacterized protein KD926_009131 [Aspergillus affinis]|uniref:uncharacterized protein n=1 Tax=Aspergillus affinis TaxID=1070780 RepID=UPI0022FEE3FA|nr:uncharacterized protein KD926_009131 [Aspergillus affinis]KAI9039788.1 hypothetical protein KD926_009131 [Aspergillus affinis]